MPCLQPYTNIIVTVLLAILALAGNRPAGAAVFVINGRTVDSSISIRIGSGGGNVSTVTFEVPVASTGDGTPVAGSRPINMRLEIRSPASNPLVGYLTVDSSQPLVNGTGGSIPLTDISWVAKDGSLPSGSFSGISNQLLGTFSSPTRISDQHRFSFSNNNLYDPGTYTGQVVYTWSAP